jgi:hypothetical protein
MYHFTFLHWHFVYLNALHRHFYPTFKGVWSAAANFVLLCTKFRIRQSNWPRLYTSKVRMV